MDRNIETSTTRSGGAEEQRRRDGGGERDPHPASEEARGNQRPRRAGSPEEKEPTRSAIRNQSQVRPEDYEGASQSGGSDRPQDKV